MIKFQGEFATYFFDKDKIDGFKLKPDDKLYLTIFLNGQTITLYAEKIEDILDFIESTAEK